MEFAQKQACWSKTFCFSKGRGNQLAKNQLKKHAQSTRFESRVKK